MQLRGQSGLVHEQVTPGDRRLDWCGLVLIVAFFSLEARGLFACLESFDRKPAQSFST